MQSLFKKESRKRMLFAWLGFLLANLIIILVTVLVKIANPGNNIAPWSSKAFSAAFFFLIKVVYLDNFLRQTPLLLGSLTLVGYLSIGRGVKDSIIGALKTIIGFILLQIGAGTLVGMAKPVFENIKEIGGSNVVPLDPYFSLANANEFLGSKNLLFLGNDLTSLMSFALLVGFIVNIILVLLKKITNVNSIMVTGHVMLQQAAVVTTIFYILLFRGGILQTAGEQIGLVLISGLFLGVYWGVASSSTLKATNLVTQDAGFAVGHQQMFAIATTYKLGRFFGTKEDSAENKKLPSYLKIFEDNIFTQTIIILFLFLVLFIILIINSKGGILNETYTGFKPENLKVWNSVFGGSNFLFIILGGSLRIVASLIAIITGVRMFITELQQSFHGISEKIIPNSVVAVDVAAVYGFSINSVTYGFLSGVIGQFLAVGLVIGLSLIPEQNFISITIPLFITLFFNSGSLGVYANASGGFRAALLLPGIIGFAEVLIVSIALRLVSNATPSAIPEEIAKVNSAEIARLTTTIKDSNNKVTFEALNVINPVATGYIGMADWTLFFGVLMIISSFNSIFAWIVIVVSIIAMLAIGQIIDTGIQTKKTFLQSLFKLNPTLKQ
ncbi:PTS ascorbate transporter subunit IIC [Mycoplasmopsis cricetuli]|uniref:PTS ascorbate transporter subunit IIC n=1 Tax=Mycoplasmopsis cricetuli TaxID=171283 RepID=UPI000470D38F|nr:PTS ascorbate transporter subunit IIC [Mycoplasmopsis cricetuli]